MALRYIIIGTLIGGVVVAGLTGSLDSIQTEVLQSDDGETAEERQAINSTNGTGLITSVTLYNDGSADVLLAEDHGCWDGIEVSHRDSDTIYKTLDAPEFQGPATFDFKGVVESNGPYPSNEFKLELVNTDDDEICIGNGMRHHYVTVPAEWTAEA